MESVLKSPFLRTRRYPGGIAISFILYIPPPSGSLLKKACIHLRHTTPHNVPTHITFPSYNPRAKSVIVLKNTKEDGGSDRNAYLPSAVYDKLMRLKEMQEELKKELGGDGYYDYGMMICQENGKPIMTEHLNRRFQQVLNEMGIKPKKGDEQYVFHSIRSTATTYKLKISGGDIKAVQGENGQKDAKMVTHQYSRILDEDRSRISDIMNEQFYGKKDKSADDELMQAAKANPDLFKQFMQFMAMTNSANKTE